MTELLKSLPYFDDLSDQEKERVAAAAYVRHYEAGTQIYGPCVECVGMIHILRGETRAYLLSDEGRKVTLFRVVENDNCIISASCVLAHLRFEAHMEVSKPSDILIVPVSCNRGFRIHGVIIFSDPDDELNVLHSFRQVDAKIEHPLITVIAVEPAMTVQEAIDACCNCSVEFS